MPRSTSDEREQEQEQVEKSELGEAQIWSLSFSFGFTRPNKTQPETTRVNARGDRQGSIGSQSKRCQSQPTVTKQQKRTKHRRRFRESHEREVEGARCLTHE